VSELLEFAELNAPLNLDGGSELLPLIGQVLAQWPHAPARDPAAWNPPFMTITGDGTGTYACQSADSPTPTRWNALNTVCDLIAELSWEQIRSHPARLCIHCAAVEIHGRLVIFPNRRRAGKSQLAAVLAHRGHKVFTDDFLPVDAAHSGQIEGVANGILPRIRLPQPDELSPEFAQWVNRNPGPSNSQYKYLETETLAPRGTRLPIGAIVLLDRKPDNATALKPIDAAAALTEVVSQNFARSTHAGRILRLASAVTDAAELYQLSYANAEQAADLLERSLTCWKHIPPVAIDAAASTPPDADLERLATPAPPFQGHLPYVQARETTCVTVGEATYLADADGLGVHRLNPTSGAIWHLLEEPTDLAEVTTVLSGAFPDVPEQQIATDCRATLSDFAENRLIVACDLANVAAQ